MCNLSYSRLEALLDADIDAVLNATPPNSHFQMAAQILRKGKHVLLTNFNDRFF
ncbi:Gfo/Idh/MocA family oxidoreductase [Paenibacillus wynnii]|uniref:Gfo/Idh/MocA family oxidoreductase n=1 Tax=Paenibacillus wynnii TaxID=268407 RepID=UPI0035946BD6